MNQERSEEEEKERKREEKRKVYKMKGHNYHERIFFIGIMMQSTHKKNDFS